MSSRKKRGFNHPVMLAVLLFLIIVQVLADVLVASTAPGGAVGAIALSALIAIEIGFDFFVMLFMVMIAFLGGRGQREVK